MYLARRRKDGPYFYHFLFVHRHFISFSGMFPHKLTDTCPNGFTWGINAFSVQALLPFGSDKTRGTFTKFSHQFTEACFKGYGKGMVKASG